MKNSPTNAFTCVVFVQEPSCFQSLKLQKVLVRVPIQTTTLSKFRKCNNNKRERLTTKTTEIFQSSSTDNNNDNNNEQTKATEPTTMSAADRAVQRLLLNQNEIKQQMYKLNSMYPTSEIDYLAASKHRAQQRVASVSNLASDEDWKQIAAEKRKQFSLTNNNNNDDDGWESSINDIGNNADSQILLYADSIDGISTTNNNNNDNNNDNNDEPKLLLF